MTIQTIEVEGAKLTRVGYTDVAIPPEFVGLTAADVARVPWRTPLWADGDRVRVGAAVWFADVNGERLAFDPFQAADSVLRADRAAEAMHQAAIAKLLAETGFARESVHRLVMTHIEGVGMVAWRNEDGSWSPFFPNARVLVSDVVLQDFLDAPPSADGDIQHEAWHALIDQGIVAAYTDGERIAGGPLADVRGAHCPGHALLHFGRAAAVTMIGHLAVSPLHLVTGECPQLQAEPVPAWALLQQTAADGRILIGPLWPSPGYGRWQGGVLIPGA
jgi:hypothetical protein